MPPQTAPPALSGRPARGSDEVQLGFGSALAGSDGAHGLTGARAGSDGAQLGLRAREQVQTGAIGLTGARAGSDGAQLGLRAREQVQTGAIGLTGARAVQTGRNWAYGSRAGLGRSHGPSAAGLGRERWGPWPEPVQPCGGRGPEVGAAVRGGERAMDRFVKARLEAGPLRGPSRRPTALSAIASSRALTNRSMARSLPRTAAPTSGPRPPHGCTGFWPGTPPFSPQPGRRWPMRAPEARSRARKPNCAPSEPVARP